MTVSLDTQASADFRALLAAHAPLVAVIGNRLALNAIPEGGNYPLVVYTTTEAPDYGLAGNLLANQVTHSVQCWATSGLKAEALAVLVRAAIAANKEYTVIGQAPVFEEDLGLDGVELTVDRWYT